MYYSSRWSNKVFIPSNPLCIWFISYVFCLGRKSRWQIFIFHLGLIWRATAHKSACITRVYTKLSIATVFDEILPQSRISVRIERIVGHFTYSWSFSRANPMYNFTVIIIFCLLRKEKVLEYCITITSLPVFYLQQRIDGNHSVRIGRIHFRIR